MATEVYSVPSQADLVFKQGILANPLVRKNLPEEADAAAKKISFEGSDSPSLPINWRFAESISALKACEATVLNALLQKKYGVEPVQVKINTYGYPVHSDHAQLFIMSTLLWTLDPDGANISPLSVMSSEGRDKLATFFPDKDKHQRWGSIYRGAATNIYKTKDERFFHLHGSMNPEPTLEFLGLPKDMSATDLEAALSPLIEAVGQRTAEEMQELADQYRQAGTICWTADEYRRSEHGKANSQVGLFDIRPFANPKQLQRWWPDAPHTSPARPLAGLKVVDLTRVIAGPAISRGLAELGASVMRITAPHLTDMSALHPDLNHGKWNAHLDLRNKEDCETLRELISEADVFLQGYRPGVLDKYGFSETAIMEMVQERDRGIIYCGENCYGWQGPWMHRSGWQQISDACCGVSYEFGRAMGNNEPVTPVFPNSDYCTGVCGVAGIMSALLRRAEHGGSYAVDVSLNYYSQWLVNSVGTYPADVWADVWKRNGTPVFRHYHNMQHLLPTVLSGLYKSSYDVLFKNEFFHQYYVKVLDKEMRIVAPILRFPNGEVQPRFDVGTRTNGVDQPRWPTDLTVEVVE